jgi:hypothetical protein
MHIIFWWGKKLQIEGLRRRWKNNTTMNLREIGCEVELA